MTFDDYSQMKKVAEEENKLLRRVQLLKERMKAAEPIKWLEET